MSDRKAKEAEHHHFRSGMQETRMYNTDGSPIETRRPPDMNTPTSERTRFTPADRSTTTLITSTVATRPGTPVPPPNLDDDTHSPARIDGRHQERPDNRNPQDFGSAGQGPLSGDPEPRHSDSAHDAIPDSPSLSIRVNRGSYQSVPGSAPANERASQHNEGTDNNIAGTNQGEYISLQGLGVYARGDSTARFVEEKHAAHERQFTSHPSQSRHSGLLQSLDQTLARRSSPTSGGTTELEGMVTAGPAQWNSSHYAESDGGLRGQREPDRPQTPPLAPVQPTSRGNEDKKKELSSSDGKG